ncbi:SRPBCC family protein [bacterium]|nr:SRPBCC family protein [bacterium]MDB4088660.1 SRPBCC family protein [Flavobacteriales bacterium]
MPVIELQTIINAPKEVVFDLARNITLHEISAGNSNEKAIDGVTTGLINLNESVTWRAKHFGFYQRLTVKITEMEKPNSFTDEMVKGIFKRISHTHKFIQDGEKTVMEDKFDYTAPLGILGKIADFLFLKRYMKLFLIERNEVIKAYAEDEKLRNSF